VTTDPRIGLDISDGTARLTLDRPEKLNALDAAMVDALLSTCREIERSNAVVVILSGAGKAFSAGGDIAAWSDESAEDFGRHWVRDGHTAFDALARLRQPLIAVLDGHTLGGGLELAAVADYRIAERQIRIGQPETGLGIIPGWSGTQRAVRRFGSQIVRRMALFGEVLTADEALTRGIVDRVTDTGAALAAAEEIAAGVLARGPRATELTKMLINAAEREETERVLEALAGTIAAGTDDLREGLAAFREKRPPKFRKDT
jgi:enoyl-CoA hydratase/carnithine racemase